MNKRKIIPYNPKLKALARDLRNNSTKAEIFLWLKLRNKQMYGYDFHRQKPIGNYILDFFCYELMLGIEIDGYSHELEEVYLKDRIKTAKMNSLGIAVLRFTDRQVSRDMFNVLLAIEDHIRRYEEHTGRVRGGQEGHTPAPSQEGSKLGEAQKEHTPSPCFDTSASLSTSQTQHKSQEGSKLGEAQKEHTPNPSQEGNMVGASKQVPQEGNMHNSPPAEGLGVGRLERMSPSKQNTPPAPLKRGVNSGKRRKNTPPTPASTWLSTSLKRGI